MPVSYLPSRQGGLPQYQTVATPTPGLRAVGGATVIG